ncbi:MAG TPA: PLP-dependent aminotransferase family protein [Anaerolineales bacterium]|nr:PLP-dependent aminotransferase family protein [Anaerolineales bacterium]
MDYKLPMTFQTVQNQIPPDTIDLGLGDPNSSLFPVDVLRRAAEERFKQGDASFLQYGVEQGDGYFRLALAEFLSRNYSLPVVADTIFVTAGVSSALDLLCTLFTQAGDTIFVEEPTYFLAPKIFADHKLHIVPIPMDENGLNIDALEEKLIKHKPKFLYTIPIHHNPSGTTLSESRRARLIELAEQYDFLILADEVYQLLSYEDNPPKPFAAHIDIENVISLGSFSKILAPGLRLGWIQAHPQKIQRLVTSGLLDSGGGMNPFTSAIVRGAIESGDLDRHVGGLIEIYRSRLKNMNALLREHLPNVAYTVPAGGYFFWLRLPGHINAVELRQQVKSLKIDIRPGTLFSNENGLQNFVRLCFAHYDEAQAELGILRLKECLETI